MRTYGDGPPDHPLQGPAGPYGARSAVRRTLRVYVLGAGWLGSTTPVYPPCYTHPGTIPAPYTVPAAPYRAPVTPTVPSV